MRSRYLQQVQLLSGAGQEPQPADVLLRDGAITAIGAAATREAQALGLTAETAAGWLLAPALVDPHSLLEDPCHGAADTLASLEHAAIAAGYGTVALLPQARSWRDTPERLVLPSTGGGLKLLVWGAFSRSGGGQELAPHGDLLQGGAIGLAEGPACPPLPLLERGLALGEMGDAPVLVAPRDPSLSQQGLVREGVEALRAGWPTDPVLSETLPLQSLLTLAALHPQRRLALMNLSTAAGVELLAGHPTSPRPAASVCWWHLLADSGKLAATAEGWRLEPPLGGPQDRRALQAALRSGVVNAVAVHHQPLDAEEHLLPLDQRKPGVAGHRFVLPCLWQELVVDQGWSVRELWQALCFGPATLLGLEAPRLEIGSRHWLLFNPSQAWRARSRAEGDGEAPLAANQPLLAMELRGQVIATGLNPDLWRAGD
jgi:dihydroorotase